MLKFLKYVLISIFPLVINPVLAQNILFPGYPKIFVYDKDVYSASLQNWDMTQDSRGYLYFANSSGVLIYDGSSWQVVELPDYNLARVVRVSQGGTIYVGGFNNFGYLAADSLGSFTYKGILPGADSLYANIGNIWNMFSANGLIFLHTDSLILIYDENKKKFFPLEADFPVYRLRKVYDSIYIMGDSIYNFDFKTRKPVVSKLNKIEPGLRMSVAIQGFKDKIILNRDDSVYVVDKDMQLVTWKDLHLPDRIIRFYASENYLFVNVIGNGLYIYDQDLNLIYHMDKESGLPINSFFNLFVDSYGNLWLNTDVGNIYIILNTPFSYIGPAISNLKTFYTTVFNDNLIVGTSVNVQYLSLDKFFSPDLSAKQFKLLDKLKGQTWDYLVSDTVMYIAHNPGIYAVNTSMKSRYIPLNETNIWRIRRIPGTDNVIIGSSFGAYLADLKDDQLVNMRPIEGLDGEILDVLADSNNVWILRYFKELELLRGFIDTPHASFVVKKKFTTDDGYSGQYGGSLVYDRKNGSVFLNDDFTIKVYRPDKDAFEVFTPVTRNFNSPKTELYLAYIDDLGGYWVNVVDYTQVPGEKYKIYYFRNVNGKLIFYKYFTNTLLYRDYSLSGYTYNNRFVILNTTKGPVVYDYNRYYDPKKYKFNVYIEKITYKDDSILWGGNSFNKGVLQSSVPGDLNIQYKHNGLIFYVAAPFYENPELTQFSYYLEGLDKTWSSWTTDKKKEYSFLREGKYTFRVKARNIYGYETPVASVSFRVLPPWYRSKVAFIVYVILFIIVVYIFSRFYAYSLRKKNEKLEEIVRERTREIEMKNAELEQQKEEIQTQAEELANINRELEKLSLIARQTDNAVILTDKHGNFVWVNHAFTKIFGYTLDELINEVSPNIISERTDQKVKRLIQKSLNEHITVEYETQFKTKSGEKIWVHTTLTPIIDENNNLAGLIAIDSDITKLKEAEAKIKLQNENIKGSIRYAQVIQKSILPIEEEISQYFETFIIYMPRDIVSGDFYWLSKKFSKLYDNVTCKSKNPGFDIHDYVFFAVVDCTGHGVPGAFMSLIGNRLLENIINQALIHDPGLVLNEMDVRLGELFKHTEETYRDGMVLSLCRFEKVCEGETPVIKVSYAGSKLDVYHYSAKSKKLVVYKASRRTIGQASVTRIDFRTEVFYARENDIIFMFTDGYKDQNNVERHRIGISQFKRLLQENAHKPMPEIKAELERFLRDWMKDTEQRDDITVVGLKMVNL